MKNYILASESYSLIVCALNHKIIPTVLLWDSSMRGVSGSPETI